MDSNDKYEEFKERYKVTDEDLNELAKNNQEDYADTMEKYAKQYPYGEKENDRILALSDEEFEKEFGDKYRFILSEYEAYKDEAAEFQTYSEDDVIEARKKYEYFKDLRNRMKNEDVQER